MNWEWIIEKIIDFIFLYIIWILGFNKGRKETSKVVFKLLQEEGIINKDNK